MKETTNSESRNTALHKARHDKQDEFYTQLSDIFAELKYYKEHFSGKTVLCNCDDPYESNFFKYFALVFNEWKIKKLICTCWDGSPIAQKELLLFDDAPEDADGRSRIAYKIELTEVKDLNEDGATDLDDVRLLLEHTKPQRLEGHGDFRSLECIELLKEADIVVTNPPFSLFREYVAQLMEFNKEFIIIGNINAVTYKEIFPYVMHNKIWFGPSIHSGDREFRVPDSYPLKAAGFRIGPNGEKYIRVKGVRWFTNIDHQKRHCELDLYKYYSPEEFPKFDNYDAINIDKTADIPIDYDGVMAVPITFLDKYCPTQFEIVEFRKDKTGNVFVCGTKEREETNMIENTMPATSISGVIKNAEGKVNGAITYARILIRRKTKS